jgi:hypothetical protein
MPGHPVCILSPARNSGGGAAATSIEPSLMLIVLVCACPAFLPVCRMLHLADVFVITDFSGFGRTAAFW